MSISVINKLTFLEKYQIYNIFNREGVFNNYSIKKSSKIIRKHV